MESFESRLSRVDLNLLTAFQVLMEERSVTGAAARLYISQPAMSKTLQRLRDLFEDALFVRTRQGLIPTPKAVELANPVKTALSQLAATLFAGPFDPASASGEVNIQIADSLAMAVIPTLYSRLQKRAPNIRLSLNNTTDEHLELLASGKSDFSIYVAQDYGKDFLTFVIGTYPPSCWMRRDHPLKTHDSVTVTDIQSYPLVVLPYHEHARHVGTSQSKIEQFQIRQFYQDYRLEEIASLKTPQLLTAMGVILSSDALLLGTPFHFSLKSEKPGLIKKPLSIGRDIHVSLQLIQHRRTEHSPLHLWLREQILQSWSGSN